MRSQFWTTIALVWTFASLMALTGCAVDGIKVPLDQVIYTVENAPDGHMGWLDSTDFHVSSNGVLCVIHSATIANSPNEIDKPIFVKMFGERSEEMEVHAYLPEETHDVVWVAEGMLEDISYAGVTKYEKLNITVEGLDLARREGITEEELVAYVDGKE